MAMAFFLFIENSLLRLDSGEAHTKTKHPFPFPPRATGLSTFPLHWIDPLLFFVKKEVRLSHRISDSLFSILSRTFGKFWCWTVDFWPLTIWSVRFNDLATEVWLLYCYSSSILSYFLPIILLKERFLAFFRIWPKLFPPLEMRLSGYTTTLRFSCSLRYFEKKRTEKRRKKRLKCLSSLTGYCWIRLYLAQSLRQIPIPRILLLTHSFFVLNSTRKFGTFSFLTYPERKISSLSIGILTHSFFQGLVPSVIALEFSVLGFGESLELTLFRFLLGDLNLT